VKFDSPAYNGYSGFKLTVTYDPSLVTYNGEELSDAAGAYATLTREYTKTDSGMEKVSITVSCGKNIQAYGEVIYLKFSVANDGNTTSSPLPQMTFSLDQVVNQSGTGMNWALVNEKNAGSVTYGTNESSTPVEYNITDRTQYYGIGDLNYDDTVDLLDVTWALQYYNGERTLTEEQLERADANRSGSFTLVDVVLIMRHYNEGRDKEDWDYANWK
jgi:hypothetical protein